MELLTLAGFDAFYAAQHRVLARYLFGIVHDRELAADLAQDTFAKALCAVQAGTVVATRAWIYRIAMNCALDALRHRQVITWTTFSALTVAPGEEEPVEFADVGAEFDQAIAERDAIAQVLEQLHPTERICLLLALEATGEVCAGRLGISLPAFKMRLGRARRHFAVLWQQEAVA